MRLLRYGAPRQERPGILDSDGKIRDLSQVVPDITGQTIGPESLARLREIDPASLPLVRDEPRLGACVGQVGKFICVGLNYSDHATETGMKIPQEPILFMKATSAICGPNDDVMIPRGSTKTDWEVELGVVIGTEAKYVEQAEAMAHVAGYCVINDLSERAFQLEGTGQWVKGKSADTFGPTGPWLVTADEIPNPGDLDLGIAVNGEVRQKSNTKYMILGAAELIELASSFYTLYPGDIISTGTPEGVSPIVPGDTIVATIEKIGTMEVKVRAA